MVEDIESSPRNLLSTKRNKREDLPAPESPISSSFNVIGLARSAFSNMMKETIWKHDMAQRWMNADGECKKEQPIQCNRVPQVPANPRFRLPACLRLAISWWINTWLLPVCTIAPGLASVCLECHRSLEQAKKRRIHTQAVWPSVLRCYVCSSYMTLYFVPILHQVFVHWFVRQKCQRTSWHNFDQISGQASIEGKHALFSVNKPHRLRNAFITCVLCRFDGLVLKACPYNLIKFI